MRVKVLGGTTSGGELPLCVTCRHASVIKGRTQQDRSALTDTPPNPAYAFSTK